MMLLILNIHRFHLLNTKIFLIFTQFIVLVVVVVVDKDSFILQLEFF